MEQKQTKPTKPAKKEILYASPLENEKAHEEIKMYPSLNIPFKMLKNYELETCALISFLMDEFERSVLTGAIQNDGSFYCIHEVISINTHLSRTQTIKYKKELIKLGWVKTKMKGSPPKEYYFLNMKEIARKLKELE